MLPGDIFLRPSKKSIELLNPALICLGMLTIAIVFFLYGKYGFNLTDEGLWLAQAKRIIAGEIPHKDFVHVKFTGSGVLHALYLWKFTDHWVMVSRGVGLFQLFSANLLWVLMLQHYLFQKPDILRVWLASTMAFMLSLHDFPIMAWNTIDGIVFATAGIFCFSRKKNILGLMLVGCSILFKQSFLPFLIFILTTIWAGKDKSFLHKLLFSGWGLAPCTLYLLWILVSGGGSDFLQQVVFGSSKLSQSEIWTGLFYRPGQWFWIGAAVAGVFLWIGIKNKGNWKTRASPLLFLLLTGGLTWASLHPEKVHRVFISSSLFLFGFTLIALLALRKSDRSLGWAGGACLALAYSVNVSVGYNNMLLMLGPLVFVFYAALLRLTKQRIPPETVQLYLFMQNVSFVALLFGFFTAFHFLRSNVIYRELPKARLTESLSGTLPGAAGVFTSPSNAEMIKDILRLMRKYPDRAVAVLPAFAGIWPGLAAQNPIANDWVQSTELPSDKSWDQVFVSLNKLRKSGGVALLSKYYVEDISLERRALCLSREATDGGYSRILNYFEDFSPSYESDYFKVYVF